MKKYIIAVSAVAISIFLLNYLYYHQGIYIDLGSSGPVKCFVTTRGKTIYKDDGDGFKPFEIRGVDLGSGIPGEWATDFGADGDTYKRWFGYIQQMGANTIRIYTIQNDTFYNAFYEYNLNNPNPLYLIHGVWVNDHAINSHEDAYSDKFYQTFAEDCRIMVDVIHGKRKLNLGRVASAGHGTYNRDISPWVIGYILGVEWYEMTVAYTDDLYRGVEGYASHQGKYMYTTPEASPFEAMLAKVGDGLIEHESRRYGQQRLVAFSNWPTTDPFVYPEEIARQFDKCAQVDVEHIKTTDAFISGCFASYHVYPYFPDFFNWVEDWTAYGIGPRAVFTDEQGRVNSYRAYLTALARHHTMPVIISEFGIPSARGMAARDTNTGRNQGFMDETGQGHALAQCYRDIIASGCAGGCIFSWQDEWFKRTWNNMYAADLRRTPYWSNFQTNEQFFGLLTFDPGDEQSICYVDGDKGEWIDPPVIQNGNFSLSTMYDEKFIYLLIEKEGLDIEQEKLYIPLDVTPKSGSNYCQNYGLKFNRQADFIISIDGKDNSRIQVQERYESLLSTHGMDVYGVDPYLNGNTPDRMSPVFVNIRLGLQTADTLIQEGEVVLLQSYETGKLRYGNANPQSEDFDSLADFCQGDGFIEMRIPWQLLNFSDPSRMYIHDDYYDGNYGVEYIHIDSIYAGLCTGEEKGRVRLEEIPLEGWQNNVTSHERLKQSYYIMQALWTQDTEG